MTAPEVAELVEQWHRYARAVAWRAARPYPWLADDLESDCLYALFRCATRYTGPGDFRAYLSASLGWAVGRRLHRERAKNPPAFRRQLGEDDVDPLDFAEGREREPADELGLPELVALFPPDLRASAYRLAAGETLGEVGKRLGVTRSAVWQRVRGVGKRVEV